MSLLYIGYTCIDQYGGFSKQGYFGVFDGHGGKEIAEHCTNRMHEIFLKLIKEESWKGAEKSLDEAFLKVVFARKYHANVN